MGWGYIERSWIRLREEEKFKRGNSKEEEYTPDIQSKYSEIRIEKLRVKH